MQSYSDEARMILAFWHRTRKKFVPLTPGEVAEKCGVSIYGVGNSLAEMKARDVLESVPYGGDCGRRSTWHLTPRGERMARNMMGAN
jgi:DNA-binding MarR family transcriptional regulator